MILYLMPKFFLGTRCFHKVKKRYEMSLSLGAHSPEDWTLTYNVQRLASIKINIWECEWQLRNLIWIMKLCTRLLQKIWTWEKFVHRLFQNIWVTIKKHIEKKCPKKCLGNLKVSQIFSITLYQVMWAGFLNMTWKLSGRAGNGTCCIHRTEESAHVQIKIKTMIMVFSIPTVLIMGNFYPHLQQWMRNFILRFWNV